MVHYNCLYSIPVSIPCALDTGDGDGDDCIHECTYVYISTVGVFTSISPHIEHAQSVDYTELMAMLNY